MTAAPPGSPGRLWRIAAWSAGTILALAILLSLGSTVWRLQQSLTLLDQDATTARSFQDMIDTSLHYTKLGLVIGLLAAPVYLISLVQSHRHHASSPSS